MQPWVQWDEEMNMVGLEITALKTFAEQALGILSDRTTFIK